MTPYLYALVDGDSRSPLGQGIEGEPLRLVRQGAIAAVVGDLAGRPMASEAILQRQDAVVRRLAELFDSLLPARFGESFADEPALLARIAAQSEGLMGALALVRGCVQMTLRVFGDREADSAEPESAGGPGKRYLETQRRARERARSLPEIEPLREALRPLLRAERLERHAQGRLLGTAFHLVPRAQTEAYLAILEGANERLGGRRIAARGPLPPYAFGPEPAP